MLLEQADMEDIFLYETGSEDHVVHGANGEIRLQVQIALLEEGRKGGKSDPHARHAVLFLSTRRNHQ